VTRTRAAHDFATIRARMEELRRDREGAERGERDRDAGSTGLVSSRPMRRSSKRNILRCAKRTDFALLEELSNFSPASLGECLRAAT
jgi:hypothetical protein